MGLILKEYHPDWVFQKKRGRVLFYQEGGLRRAGLQQGQLFSLCVLQANSPKGHDVGHSGCPRLPSHFFPSESGLKA